MASLVIYINSYPACPRRITVKYKRSLEGLKRKFHMQENVNSGVNKKRLKIQIPNSLFIVESALSSQASSQALHFLRQT